VRNPLLRAQYPPRPVWCPGQSMRVSGEAAYLGLDLVVAMLEKQQPILQYGERENTLLVVEQQGGNHLSPKRLELTSIVDHLLEGGGLSLSVHRGPSLRAGGEVAVRGSDLVEPMHESEAAPLPRGQRLVTLLRRQGPDREQVLPSRQQRAVILRQPHLNDGLLPSPLPRARVHVEPLHAPRCLLRRRSRPACSVPVSPEPPPRFSWGCGRLHQVIYSHLEPIGRLVAILARLVQGCRFRIHQGDLAGRRAARGAGRLTARGF
jgi:hypothetical protein